MSETPMTYVLLVILFAVIFVLIFLIVNLNSQIKQIRKQLRFIAHNKTNQKIRIHTPSREVKGMVNDINYLIESTREEEIATMRKDEELRDTIVNMSHDIRTPLTSLSGYFDLLLATDSPEEKTRYSSIIKERINSLSELLESMFFYTKLSSDAIKPELNKCDVSALLVQTMLSYFDDFEKLGIEPQLDIEEDLSMISDERFLRRIFQNLIKNALTHGQDELKVSLKKDPDPSKKRITLIMANKYDKTAPIDVDKVFNRFYQSDRTRNNNSSGIGLAVVQKLVRLINGNVSARLDGDFFEIVLVLKN